MDAKRPRERLSFIPEWNETYQRWTANFVKENKWRFDPAVDGFYDLMQEAWMVFDKIAYSYPRVTDPQHFFSLYHRALVNKFHDKASLRRRRFEGNNAAVSSTAAEIILNNITDYSNSGYLAALLAEAPEEIKLALRHLSTGGFPKKSVRMSVRQNLSSRLRQALNLPKDVDPVTELKRLLAA